MIMPPLTPPGDLNAASNTLPPLKLPEVAFVEMVQPVQVIEPPPPEATVGADTVTVPVIGEPVLGNGPTLLLL